ncbi:hypothetical protein HYY74_06555 [Candidatus Woesearchaeota archaeon]|nr:hypothetical protein [Candidatus Woesearchaeota archaeon]
MGTLTHLLEGIRIFRHSASRKFNGWKQYNGDAKAICRQIVADCWNGRYFQTSTGHYRQFYTRDFGICAEALVSLGCREKVARTLDFALSRFRRHGHATVAITPKGRPFDFPNYAVDTLPFLMRALKAAKSRKLVEENRNFLESETRHLLRIAVDKKTGLVRKDRTFSSLKDYAARHSSCYDNAMLGMLSKYLDKLGMENPLRKYDYQQLIKEHFWTGEYFLDDLSGKKYVASDANIFPYWAGLIQDKQMMRSSVKAIRKEGLDQPTPLKYTKNRQRMIFLERIVSGWQTHACWTILGPIYIRLLKRIDGKAATVQTEKFSRLIERHGNYPEILDSKGRPFQTLLYHSDAGMIWASLYLELTGQKIL